MRDAALDVLSLLKTRHLPMPPRVCTVHVPKSLGLAAALVPITRMPPVVPDAIRVPFLSAGSRSPNRIRSQSAKIMLLNTYTCP